MSKDIEFEGLEALEKMLDSITDRKKMIVALGKACALVERSAKQKAPKGDGSLRRSISSKVDPVAQIGVVFTPLEYAPYVEYGTGLFAEDGNGRKDVPWHYQDEKGEWHTTSGMKPQPYMRPALNENRQQIMEILKEGMASG
jgi:HK97 gp10 family phage protein